MLCRLRSLKKSLLSTGKHRLPSTRSNLTTRAYRRGNKLDRISRVKRGRWWRIWRLVLPGSRKISPHRWRWRNKNRSEKPMQTSKRVLNQQIIWFRRWRKVPYRRPLRLSKNKRDPFNVRRALRRTESSKLVTIWPVQRRKSATSFYPQETSN